MRHGLTEEQVNKVLDYENSDLPERTKMALRLTDKMAFDHHSVDEKFYAGLREHFSDDAIMDLGMMAAFALMVSSGACDETRTTYAGVVREDSSSATLMG